MSSEQDDKTFLKSFGTMLVLLTMGGVILALLAVFASSFEPSRNQARAELERERTEERLQPMGRVRESGELAPVAMNEDDGGGAASADSGGSGDGGTQEVAMSGSEVNNSACMSCHANGVMNAPVTGNNDDWSQRYEEKGLDTLVSHAINGFNAMPARGGNSSLSDQEVRNAVVYLLEESGVEVSAE